MDLNKYLSRVSNVFAINRLLVVVTIVMASVTIVMVQTINRQMEARATVLVPMTSKGPMEIGSDSASPEYLRAMARYIVNLAFTYTSESARKQFEELLTLYAPERRELERRQWLSVADKIRKVRRVSRSFFIDDIQKDPTKDRLIIRGTTVRRLGNKLETEPAVIEMRYRIQFGRFLLEEMRRTNTVAGKGPRVNEERLKQIVDQASGGDDVK